MTFQLHTAGLHQAIYSINLLSQTTFVPPWLLVIGLSQTSLMVGGFRSKALLALSEEETDPSAVRCGGDRLSCCLIVGINTSGISIPLSLLIHQSLTTMVVQIVRIGNLTLSPDEELHCAI